MWDRKPAQSVNNPLGVLGDADQTIDGEMTIKARMLKAGVHAGTAKDVLRPEPGCRTTHPENCRRF